LLRPLLGITDARLDAKTHVDYTADLAEAVRLARAGTYQAAFLIAPTTPAEIQAVVRGGELMPQKSTHFYPKLLDGLVFHRLGGGGFTPTAAWALSDGVARFCGEAVAAVVATSPYVAADARELVAIDWEVLPVVTTLDAALAQHRILFERRHRHGDVAGAFAS